jgi:hypothetical protein
MNIRTLALSGASLGALTLSLVGVAHTPVGATVAQIAVKSCNKVGPCLAWTNTANGSGTSIPTAFTGTATGNSGSGFFGEATGLNGSGVWGRANIDNSGSAAAGVYGDSFGTAVGVFGYAHGSGEAIFGRNATSNTGAWEMSISNGDAQTVMYVDDGGDMSIVGNLTVDGSCTGCSETNRLRSYAQRTTTPQLEDVGEGIVRNGRAYVALDASLVRGIDGTKPYLVTITPEGDCDGLYVANRTPQGFEVRELHGGRSSVQFAYRLVAHPYGAPATRLPLITQSKYQPALPH